MCLTVLYAGVQAPCMAAQTLADLNFGVLPTNHQGVRAALPGSTGAFACSCRLASTCNLWLQGHGRQSTLRVLLNVPVDLQLQVLGQCRNLVHMCSCKAPLISWY